jgi:hypothetical protein
MNGGKYLLNGFGLFMGHLPQIRQKKNTLSGVWLLMQQGIIEGFSNWIDPLGTHG